MSAINLKKIINKLLHHTEQRPRLNRQIIKEAKAGDSKSQFKLGAAYYSGNGMKQDYEKAFYWFSEAAKHNDISAQYNVATMYYDGLGVEADNKKALHWFELAAVGGKITAFYALGCLKLDLIEESEEHCSDLTEQMVQCFEYAAFKGHPASMFQLGVLKLDGDIIEKDIDEGIRLIKTSARKGNIDAQITLGDAYAMGIGVMIDLIEAKLWYQAAKRNGSLLADERLNEMRKAGL